MIKKISTRGKRLLSATHDDLVRALGDVEASKAAAILALQPTVAELEEAAVRLAGEEEDLVDNPRQAKGVVAEILNIVAIDEENEERRP
jgi:hypothetical protein